MRRRFIWVLILATLLIAGTVMVNVPSASAAVDWCESHLAPMSTTAEAQIVGTPASDIQSQHIISVPSVAVSTEKGGSNPHK
ncbi:MAG: hypothetical protein M1136_03400 [Chloroflexi bacterium]|nr:hypothetical protein [Chloroflexota bacterium]MCL5074685.1 hypothetical protein [Chloroflexota bacterium]